MERLLLKVFFNQNVFEFEGRVSMLKDFIQQELNSPHIASLRHNLNMHETKCLHQTTQLHKSNDSTAFSNFITSNVALANHWSLLETRPAPFQKSTGTVLRSMNGQCMVHYCRVELTTHVALFHAGGWSSRFLSCWRPHSCHKCRRGQPPPPPPGGLNFKWPAKCDVKAFRLLPLLKGCGQVIEIAEWPMNSSWTAPVGIRPDACSRYHTMILAKNCSNGWNRQFRVGNCSWSLLVQSKELPTNRYVYDARLWRGVQHHLHIQRDVKCSRLMLGVRVVLGSGPDRNIRWLLVCWMGWAFNSGMN